MAFDTVLSPRTVCTSGATAASTAGACWLTIPLAPLLSATCANETEKARAAAPAVVLTGIDRCVRARGAGLRPWARSEVSTALICAALGPKR